MPLKAGKQNVGWNIKELTEHGSRPRSHEQIVAIALHASGVTPKGGALKRMARGTKKK